MTAKAMDEAALRPKERIYFSESERKELKARQMARGLGHAYKMETNDGRSLPANRHPRYNKVRCDDQGSAAEAAAAYSGGSSSWSSYAKAESQGSGSNSAPYQV